MSSKTYSITLLIVVFLTIILSVFFSFWKTIGVGMTIIAIINFLYFSHKQFDIRHLIILIATGQWIFASILSYYFIPSDDVYSMKVSPEQYFSFTIPAVLLYSFGILFPIQYPKFNKQNFQNKINTIKINNKNIDIILIAVGLLFSVFNNVVPISLRFIFFLLSGIQFVGLIMLLTNPYRKKKKLILIIAGILLLIIGILKGGFGLIFTWLIASFVIYNYFVNLSLKQKIIMFLLAISVGYVMQSVKMQYRAITWMGDKEFSIPEKLTVFSDLLMSKPEIKDEKTDKSVISRINQGWIISDIIKNMEQLNGKYLKGETIYRSILSTILPGSFYDDKLIAGGQEYFTRFTGRRIGKTTSMNISVLGEAYGNYGRVGAFVFMFLFCLFLNFSTLLVNKIIIKKPLVIFFIPMIFQQVIKAEGDFFIVLNHLVKSSIFVVIIYIVLSQFFRLKVKN